jgi:hypothetical protein
MHRGRNTKTGEAPPAAARRSKRKLHRAASAQDQVAEPPPAARRSSATILPISRSAPVDRRTWARLSPCSMRRSTGWSPAAKLASGAISAPPLVRTPSPRSRRCRARVGSRSCGSMARWSRGSRRPGNPARSSPADPAKSQTPRCGSYSLPQTESATASARVGSVGASAARSRRTKKAGAKSSRLLGRRSGSREVRSGTFRRLRTDDRDRCSDPVLSGWSGLRDLERGNC